MTKHILLISYDERMLLARRTLLEQQGYRVCTALRFKEAMATCKDSSFDLLILAHAIPSKDKRDLIATFRTHSTAPILSLWNRDAGIGERVDYLAFSDAPDLLVANVASILSRTAAAEQGG